MSNSNLRDLLEMNLTKTATAKRAGCGTVGLDRACIKEFGKTWNQIKEDQRNTRNAALAHRPVTGLRYFGPANPYSNRFK